MLDALIRPTIGVASQLLILFPQASILIFQYLLPVS
jgi:hypothetical protein